MTVFCIGGGVHAGVPTVRHLQHTLALRPPNPPCAATMAHHSPTSYTKSCSNESCFWRQLSVTSWEIHIARGSSYSGGSTVALCARIEYSCSGGEIRAAYTCRATGVFFFGLYPRFFLPAVDARSDARQ